MNIFRLGSDLHREFVRDYNIDQAREIFPRLDTDPVTTLLLAGDIGVITKPRTYVPWIEDWAQQFERIVYIMGNHEHYNGCFDNTVRKAKERLAHLENVHVLEQEVLKLDDCNIIAATLWTGMNDANYHTMQIVKTQMNDFQTIRVAGDKHRKLQPIETVRIHEDTVQYIDLMLTELKGQKNIVMTHHAPCHLSVHPRYRGQELNHAFYTDLTWLMDKHAYPIHIHGHMHNRWDYEVYNTRVLCNPFGYATHNEQTGYDPTLTFEL